MPKYVVYVPPEPELPHLAVVIENGEVVACEPVASKREGASLLEEVAEVEPEFLAEARRARN